MAEICLRLSYRLLSGSPFTGLVGRALPAIFSSLGSFPEETVSYVSVDLVCLWEEVSSGSFFLHRLLGLGPPCNSIEIYF